MASGATSFEVGFVIGLNSVAFRTLVANPLLVIAVFSSKMFLNPNEIAQGVTRVVVQTTGFGANKHSFLDLLCLSLQQFPWHFVPSSVHLKALVSLEPLVADLANVAV